MKRICIVSDQHLSSNPRAWKEANTLAAAGYAVTILTIWTSATKRERDKEFLHHPSLQYKAGLNLIPGEIEPWRGSGTGLEADSGRKLTGGSKPIALGPLVMPRSG